MTKKKSFLSRIKTLCAINTTTGSYTTTIASSAASSAYVSSTFSGVYPPNSTIIYGPSTSGHCLTVNPSTGSPMWSTFIKNPINLLEAETLEVDFTKESKKLNTLIFDYSLPDINYCFTGTRYKVFIENDLSSAHLEMSDTNSIWNKKLRFAILALDSNLNRLEFSSVIPETSPKANLSNLIDDNFSIKQDKKEYINTLYSRYIPCICMSLNSSNTTEVSHKISLLRDNKSGIIPIMHYSNLIFGNLIVPNKQDVNKLYEDLTREVIVFTKEQFPKIQPHFSPEYGYLTLDTKKNIKKICREHSIYTDTGLVSLLQNISVLGSECSVFSAYLLDHIGLDQSITDVAGTAISNIKYFIENTY